MNAVELEPASFHSLSLESVLVLFIDHRDGQPGVEIVPQGSPLDIDLRSPSWHFLDEPWYADSIPVFY